jgi:archaetidylinositol phosphate synthase
MTPLLLAAAVVAPLFAVWVVIDYRRVLRQSIDVGAATSEVAR